MTQLEIEYFWPLTEQIKLDLDYTPSEEWIAEWRKLQYQPTVTSGSYLISGGSTGMTAWNPPHMTSFVVKSNTNNVGKWEISDNMFVYRTKKPNALIRHMAKYFFGFKWHDEI